MIESGCLFQLSLTAKNKLLELTEHSTLEFYKTL